MYGKWFARCGSGRCPMDVGGCLQNQCIHKKIIKQENKFCIHSYYICYEAMTNMLTAYQR